MSRCLDADTLLALATGEDGNEARAHLHACAGCAARLEGLERDLLLLRRVLRDEPLPARRSRPRWAWAPAAAGLGAAALLALLWTAPWRTAPAGHPLWVAQVPPLAHDVSAALFASARPLAAAEPLSDGAYLAAALNGGFRCSDLDAYGADCQSATDLTDLEQP